MIMAGAHITQADEKLVKLEVETLYHKLLHPKPNIESTIRQLRIIRDLNPSQYRNVKKTLPYVVCGAFNPPNRRTENFAYTQHFIIDVDHLQSQELTVADVRRRIQADERVHLCFISPSGDGLKVLFDLKERCYDSGIYSAFYKIFASQWSRELGLSQVIDSKTSDVARACFISIDPEAYYNPQCAPIDLQAYVNYDTPAGKNHSEKPQAPVSQPEPESEPNKGDPDSEIIANIRRILNPNARPTRQNSPVFVPPELDDVMSGLTDYIRKTGLEVTEITNIQYAKKIQISMGLKKAEINLFFGKRGFTVVKSPKCGTDPTLNDLVAELIQTYIDMQ